MKWTSVKSANEIQLAGITVELIFEDKTLKGAILTDAKGITVKFTQESYSSFKAMVPEQPVKEKRYVLHGDLPSGKFREIFAERDEAINRRDEMEAAFTTSITLKLDHVEVLVAEDGAVKDEDIPF